MGGGLEIDLAAGRATDFLRIGSPGILVASDGAEIGVDTLVSIEDAVGGSGDDTFTGRAKANYLDGADGADSLEGGEGNDELLGGEGDDLLDGGEGGDGLDGGTGIDTAEFARTLLDVGVIVDLAAGTATDGAGSVDALAGLENATGTAFADTLAGDAGANALWGSYGDDVLVGRGGDDLVDGGDGDDRFEFSGTTGGYDTVVGGGGIDTIRALANGTTVGLRGLDSVAVVTAGGFTGVTVQGSGAGDTLDLTGTTLTGIERVNAGGGDDVLTGSAAADTLWGGSGRDRIAGRAGNDVLDGGTGVDTVSYASAAAGVTADLAAGIASVDGDGGSDTLLAIEDVLGSGFADSIAGNGSANVLRGGGGNDTISAGATSDILRGDAGDDVLDGGNDNDAFEYAGTSGGYDTVLGGAGVDTIRALADGTVIGLRSASSVATVTADGFSGVTVQGSAAGDTLDFTGTTLIEIGRVNAGGGDDVLTGSTAGDILWGGSGRDRVVGGVGDDTLDGGSGSDRAVFAGPSSSYTITAVGGALQIIDNDATADGNDGTDTLTGIETAEFKGGVTVALAAAILQPRDGVGLLEIAHRAVDPDWAWGLGA